MTRTILSMLILISCVQSGACQDQRSKGSSDATRGEGRVRSACQIEIEKFCRGEERAGRCLRDQNPNELSEGCKAALARRGSQ
jgi:hypothetical protein